jgi:hypothetical protein
MSGADTDNDWGGGMDMLAAKNDQSVDADGDRDMSVAGECLGASYQVKARLSGGVIETSPKPSRTLAPVIRREFS